METSPYRVAHAVQLGRVLARIRSDEGLSQQEMADRIGVHRSYLARMENGLETSQLKRIFGTLHEAGYEMVIRRAPS